MYDLYSQEKSAAGSSSGEFDFWSQDAGNGTTIAESAKSMIMMAVEQREVLYEEAMLSDYELTTEESTSVDEKVKTTREEMTEEQREIDGLDEESLRKVFEKDAIISRYRQEVINDLEIDYEKIKADINREEYKQYDLQYYSVAMTKTDDQGASQDLTEIEKNALKDKMNKLIKKSKKNNDFTKLLGENDQSGIQYQTHELRDSDTTFISEKAREDIKKMKNGEITKLLTGDDGGLYLVKMINNNSEGYYNETVTQANQTEESTQFDSEYNRIVSEGYEIIRNNSQWDRIKMGTVTV
jgi:foldase protein PrsA